MAFLTRLASIAILGSLWASAQASRVETRAVVATVADAPIYDDELVAAAHDQLVNLQRQEYEIKRRTLDSIIERRLIAEEAARRRIAPEQLIAGEVYAKVGNPTDGELEAFYLGQRGTFGDSFEKAKPRVLAAYGEAKRDLAKTEFMRQLRENASTAILLEPPRVRVGIDPARLQGRADASVQIVEFSDFECPFCARVQESLKTVLRKYGDRVAISFRDFPLSNIHPNAMIAAVAARCAADQGKFWSFHDTLFANSGNLKPQALKDHAAAAGLDTAALEQCIAQKNYSQAIQKDIAEGKNAGVSATPSFFVNGIAISGAQSAAAFEKLIDEELARAKRKPARSSN